MFYCKSPYSAFFTSGLLSANEHLSSNDSPRRGSLPVTVSSRPSVNVNDDASAFYFSVQPKRNSKELRSFLSLDLAESSYSVRSASLEQKARSISTVESTFGFGPAQKPVPSTALPAIPQNEILSVNSHANPSGMFVSKSAPIRRRGTCNTTSTVSTRYRRIKRNDALARLEGRTRPPTPNFMCLDDDEDEGDWELVQQASPVDTVSSITPEDHHQTSGASLTTLIKVMMEDENIIVPPSPAEKSFRATPRSSMLTSSTRSSPSAKKRARASSWLPLRSFIDLEDGPGAAPWRSFIEISTLS